MNREKFTQIINIFKYILILALEGKCFEGCFQKKGGKNMRKMSRISLVCAMILLIIVGTPFSAFAGEKPSGKPFEAIWEELDELQEQIDDLQVQINDLQAKLDAEEAARIAADADLQEQVDDIQAQLDDLQAQIDAERAERIAADSDLQYQIDNHKHAGEDITSGKIDNARLNTGHGNGLNADTVDGKHASDLGCLWSESENGIYYDEGYVGIGTSEPHGLLHVAGSVGGVIYWDSDSVDDTVITIIPDGPQDVKRGVSYSILIAENTGSGTGGHRSGIAPGETKIMYNDGTDVLTLNCASDGSLTIYRESGSDTFKVVLWLYWM
jgi:hypothetical protein